MRRWRAILARAVGLLGLYLEDLLLVSGGGCLTAAAAVRYGAAGGLTAAGVCLIVCSVLVARSGRR